MKLRRSLYFRFFAASALALGLNLAAVSGAATTPPSPAQPMDLGLADWRLQPLSDFASHGVLWRRSPGLLAWRLSSARAFGSLAAAPNPAKLLFDLDLSVLVEGQARPRFLSATASVEDGPLWSSEMAEDKGLRAKAVTLFCAQDLLVAVVTLENTGGSALRVRPSLNLSRDGLGLAGGVQVSGHHPAVWLTLDRGQALGRSLVEYAGVWMAAPDLRVDMGDKGLKARQTRALDSQGLHLSMSWMRSRLLKPGQSLRLPILLAWGGDEARVQKAAETQWQASALPQGKALVRARKRWVAMLAPLPRLAQHERLLRRAVLDLYLDDYGRQEALSGDEFSAQKGLRDAFFSVDSPLAALGWSELDMGKAQAAVLDLSSFSARDSVAVPPYCGDEKLSWDAAGLPLNALAAWELYHRDPQPQRAAQFLATFGTRLRNECAWWPPNRDGDGNGLYAFSGPEEEPSYMLAPDSPVFSKSVSLESWSLGLTSLVAWQMQVAAALAQAAGNKPESDHLLAVSKHSQEAIHDQAWDLTRSAYVQGLDGFWPLLLGLDNDDTRAKGEIEGWFLKALAQNQDPWLENGAWEPWRVYFAARTLAAYGYFKESKAISDNFVDKMEKMDSFPSKINADASYEGGDSAATAASILEFLLEREQQEVFLTASSGEFSARFIQFHSLDGSFYMRRMQLPQKNNKYALIKIETPKHGKILDEKAFVFSSPEAMTFQIQSSSGLESAA